MRSLIAFALLIASTFGDDHQELSIPSSGGSNSVSKGTLEASLIINGRGARPKQIPYQVGLMLDYGNGGEYTWCGGTLLSNQWILTAAHCTEGVVAATVYLGAVDRTNRNETGQQRIDITDKNIIVHEGWNSTTFVHDISLIKLPEPVTLNKYISPAKLPKRSRKYSNYSGVSTIMSGWGKIKDTDQIVTNKLQWTTAPVMPNFDCAPFYNTPKVRDTNICTRASKGRSTCNGDSGGPLVLADGSNTLIGITSFGLDSSCEQLYPSVFTRVTQYLPWILKLTGIVKNEC